MAMIATDFKVLFSIKIKSRHDGYTDQYNRIFMVKLLLMSSIIMGISWYKDSINCMVPKSHDIADGDKFVSATCWIQGVYVYKELSHRVDSAAYFGIPKDMGNNGMLPDGALCTTEKRFERDPNPNCKEMEKTYYLQYQWMPFLIAALTVLYYIPYIAFKTANIDLISLKDTLKKKNSDAGKIAKYYFLRPNTSKRVSTNRVVFNILIKIMYVVANLVTFYGLDNLLNNEFAGYGNKWVKWSQFNNSIAFDYLGMRDFPKPGNAMLPPFGYCEVYESAKDVKQTIANKHKFVCELSQNILYQYCLIVLWFAIIIGIVISFIGLIILVVNYVMWIIGIRRSGPTGKKLYKALSLRELEYLEFIRNRDIVLYGEVLEKLRHEYLGPSDADTMPLYPSLPPKDPYEEKRPGFEL